MGCQPFKHTWCCVCQINIQSSALEDPSVDVLGFSPVPLEGTLAVFAR